MATVHPCFGSQNRMKCCKRSAVELGFDLLFSLIDVDIPPMVKKKKYYQLFGSIALNDLWWAVVIGSFHTCTLWETHLRPPPLSVWRSHIKKKRADTHPKHTLCSHSVPAHLKHLCTIRSAVSPRVDAVASCLPYFVEQIFQRFPHPLCSTSPAVNKRPLHVWKVLLGNWICDLTPCQIFSASVPHAKSPRGKVRVSH